MNSPHDKRQGIDDMSQTTVQLALGKQKIIEDIKVLLNDSEELLRLSASLPGEGVDALRARLRDHVETARVRSRATARASTARRSTCARTRGRR
jgi:ElaB/YqjD/DUF883 family membrane-anchored ribosome-binding protein